MPAEVLVMCRACGRPQSAGRRHCAFCGAALPDAPLPHASALKSSAVSVDLGRGRGLSAGDERLAYQGRPDGPPVVVEWARVRRLEWETRPYLEALGLLAFALLSLLAPTPALKGMAMAAAVVGVVLAALYRHHALTVEVADGAKLRWPLGMALRGSGREARLKAARDALEAEGRARGVRVSASPGPGPASPGGPGA